MLDFEDYYQPSEYEKLIKETTDKIVKGILNDAKDEVESYKNKYETLTKYHNALIIDHREQTRENKELKKKIEDLEMRLNSKLHSIPNHKYNVGDEVYTVGGSWGCYANCPTCNGKGKIKATTEEYGEIEAVCPDCGTNRRYKTKVEYRNLYPVKAKVSRVNIYLSAKEDLKVCYGTGSMPIEECKVFGTLEECKEYCDKATEEAKQNALKELGANKENK